MHLNHVGLAFVLSNSRVNHQHNTNSFISVPLPPRYHQTILPLPVQEETTALDARPSNDDHDDLNGESIIREAHFKIRNDVLTGESEFAVAQCVEDVLADYKYAEMACIKVAQTTMPFVNENFSLRDFQLIFDYRVYYHTSSRSRDQYHQDPHNKNVTVDLLEILHRGEYNLDQYMKDYFMLLVENHLSLFSVRKSIIFPADLLQQYPDLKRRLIAFDMMWTATSPEQHQILLEWIADFFFAQEMTWLSDIFLDPVPSQKTREVRKIMFPICNTQSHERIKSEMEKLFLLEDIAKKEVGMPPYEGINPTDDHPSN